MKTNTWVVKLGGSLCGSPTLALWILALSQSRTLIVPGGGPFAELVRTTQKEVGFNDAIAHPMAILGMAQFGYLLHGLPPYLPLQSGLALPPRQEGVQSRIWYPDLSLLLSSPLAHSWNVTSDTIAVWLAGKAGVRDVLLVKSVDLPTGPQDAKDLASRGIIDQGLSDLIRQSKLRVWTSGPLPPKSLETTLTDPEAYLTQVVSA